MSETPFADQVERELKAVQEFWDHLRANPAIQRLAADIARHQLGEWKEDA